MGEHHLPAGETGACPRSMSTGMPALSIAPMMDITDRHFRSFLRTISRHTLLYTEMVTEQAVRFGDPERLLGFHPAEQPLVLQLGGSDPAGLAEAVRIGFQAGYREVNLNVGCPSDRVQSGRFGACLMLDPELVAELVSAMRSAAPVRVTVKHRIGVDHADSFAELLAFVDTVAAAGVTRFTVHARKAWLKGLSPRENREIPPLRHDLVVQLATQRPELAFELNGGVQDLNEAAQLLGQGGIRAVMIGRAVAAAPWLLHDADSRFFGAADPAADGRSAVRAWLPYVEDRLSEGVPFRVLIRPLLGMFRGERGGRLWRRQLSEAALDPASGACTIEAALALVSGTDAPAVNQPPMTAAAAGS